MSAFPAFVDFLTIRQDHPEGGLPVLNGGKVLRIDADGEVEYAVDRRVGLEGSFDSRVELGCDGWTVSFSGNVSRFGRRDNLFGYGWSECLRRVNALLNVYSLPPFTAGKLYRFADSGWTWTGARVSRIDVTCNYACGSVGKLEAVIRAMAAQHVGRQKGSLTVDGATVEYGRGSTYVYSKLYAKHVELEKHRSRRSGAHVGDDVLDFCRAQGVLREEHTLKSAFLRQSGLGYIGAVDDQVLIDIYLERSQFRRVSAVEFDSLDGLPRYLRATYVSWREGWPQGHLSRATFYRHRSELLKYGIDISVAHNVATIPIRVRVVDVAALEAPPWYWERHG